MPRTDDDYVCEILGMEKILRAVLHRFAPQPADLEDLLQETFSRLFSLDTVRRQAIRNLQAFAITTARHAATDWIRHSKVVPIETVEELSELDVYVQASDLEEIVHTHQQLTVLARSMARLPERSREVFTLRRVYGLTQKEIATKLGISEGAVEQLLIRSMRHCAEVLSAGADDELTRAAEKTGWLGRWKERLKKGRGP